jgi:hypothetical protein
LVAAQSLVVPWPHLVPVKAFPGEWITNQICKESASASRVSGKFDYLNPPFPDSKRMAWEFFPDN